jgi:hypothetical protein
VPHGVVLGEDFPSNYYAGATSARAGAELWRGKKPRRFAQRGTGTVQTVEHAHDAVRFAERQRLEQLCVPGYLPIAVQPPVRLVAAI